MAASVAGVAPERRPAPPRKSAPGHPWSHLETIHLIEAYEERWYSLKRGQLKAQQWEDVSAAVAARCGLASPSKSGTQCRHKMEKLRKRYRADRLRPFASAWPYFELMDRMERGPLPISARPPPSHSTGGLSGAAASSDEDEEDDLDDERIGGNTRSINGIIRDVSWRPSGSSRSHRIRKRKDFDPIDEDSDEEDGQEDSEEQSQAVPQLAAVVRRFGDGLERMEKRRVELMREVERDWMEMETKRAEMIMESQRCLVEMIAGAFTSSRKSKKSPDL